MCDNGKISRECKYKVLKDRSSFLFWVSNFNLFIRRSRMTIFWSNYDNQIGTSQDVIACLQKSYVRYRPIHCMSFQTLEEMDAVCNVNSEYKEIK